MKGLLFQLLVLIDGLRLSYQIKFKKRVDGWFYMDKPLAIDEGFKITRAVIIRRHIGEQFVTIKNQKRHCVIEVFEVDGNRCFIKNLYWRNYEHTTN